MFGAIPISKLRVLTDNWHPHGNKSTPHWLYETLPMTTWFKTICGFCISEWSASCDSISPTALKKNPRKCQIWSITDVGFQIGSFPVIILYIHGIHFKAAWSWILLLPQAMIKNVIMNLIKCKVLDGRIWPRVKLKTRDCTVISDTNQTEAPPTDTEWSFREDPSWNDFCADLQGNDRRCLANTERELDEIWA